VERRLVGAERVDLAGEDSARQRVAPRVRPELAAALELVRALLDDPGREAELPRVAAVVPAREDCVLRPEPLRPLGRQHRVDDDALVGEVVRADLAADALPERRPVPETGGDLLHARSVLPRNGAAKSANPLMKISARPE
jgi:hypothetical protein